MQRVTMRFAISVAAVLLCVAPVGAQTPQQEPGAPAAATRTAKLTLEQRHTIRELVRELKVGQAADDHKVATGDAVPAKVSPQPIPTLIGQKVPSIRSHHFYVTQKQIVIVDPQEKKVVEVIE
ncbi:MAG: DUF1236 domain-containing protein [Rhizobiales bacterium]|nr:DUF1236 domain-containing protein [Hyphomicrobiales bacterium]